MAAVNSVKSRNSCVEYVALECRETLVLESFSVSNSNDRSSSCRFLEFSYSVFRFFKHNITLNIIAERSLVESFHLIIVETEHISSRYKEIKRRGYH